jgi:tRNA G46 methylase TrmB
MQHVLFCCLQDPHFKVANHRRRIIQPTLLTEYAHIMAPGGWLYTITDVPELGEWMVSCYSAVLLRLWLDKRVWITRVEGLDASWKSYAAMM